MARKGWDIIDHHFYDNIIVEENGSEYRPTRGHGLGMANSLTTIMQIVIFNMTIGQMALIKDFEPKKIGALFLNDDAAVVLQEDWKDDWV